MASFTYKLITTDGKEKNGTLEAETRDKALAQLKADGSTVIEVKTGGALSKQINIGSGPKVKTRDLGVFCRQFESLLQAGVGVVPALEMLGEQTENKTLQTAVMNIRDGIQKGDTLAGAMKKESCFPPILISMMEAGEASGSLEKSLNRMAEHFDKDTRVKAMLKKAMIYPIILMVVAVGVLILMVVVVIPQFSSMFADMGTKLPAVTQGLLNLSYWLRKYWYIAIIIIAAVVFGIKMFKKTDYGKHFFAKLAIKLPVFGRLTVKTACARFARTFGTMLASGMSMVEAMEITAKTMDNVLFREALEDATQQIQRGVPINQPLRKSGLFPPLILHMVGIGEETGNLEEMLNNCAVYYDEEVEMATQQVMAMMEPMIIIVLAGIVILILAAIYGPIITMYNTLGDM